MERWLSWSKAHDWKSCNVSKAFWGSNPHLSARNPEPLGSGFFVLSSHLSFQKKCLTNTQLSGIIVERCDAQLNMERWLSWSKAHDWKSCNVSKAFWGSNPHLSARNPEPLGSGFFVLSSHLSFQKKCLTNTQLSGIIVERCDAQLNMERWLSWSKAHDWKSCNVSKAFWGSNPHLSARSPEPLGSGLFVLSGFA